MSVSRTMKIMAASLFFPLVVTVCSIPLQAFCFFKACKSLLILPFGSPFHINTGLRRTTSPKTTASSPSLSTPTEILMAKWRYAVILFFDLPFIFTTTRCAPLSSKHLVGIGSRLTCVSSPILMSRT